ncbi:Gp19/Gp15/Gp42 family protein [Bifidobacterium callitrichos]|uniref:Gp19/Gp15/Gp42 family protein n=1 Tax=Bifidobacterium callitrichos TaxID=762209 RepID=UPI00068F7BCA|nr:Gp19/Gp15/Gp42 family protein [Bifidobacterium callitrichos]
MHGPEFLEPIIPKATVEPPFATVSDLESRWRKLTPDEAETAASLLDDASDKIMTDCPGWVNASAKTLRRIACAMVKRAMIAGDSAALGITQSQQTVGPFSQMYSYSNPTGDLYLTASEKQSLGQGVQTAYSVSLLTSEAGR